MKNTRPNYLKIFEDIIARKCPERKNEFERFFAKDISALDIIDLNNKIFGLQDRETIDFNQQHKSYDKETILQILTFQQEQKLTNIGLANHFKLSRNTVSKWKRLYKTQLDGK